MLARISTAALALTCGMLVGAPPASADSIATTPAAPATKQTRQPTVIKGFGATSKTVSPGAILRNRVRVVGGAPRVVKIQYRGTGATKWTTLKTAPTTEDGLARIRMTVLAGREQWRLKAKLTETHRTAESSIKNFTVTPLEPVDIPDPAPAPTTTTPSRTGYPSISAEQIAANKAYARAYILKTFGWGDDQWLALEQLWTRESGWNHLAVNQGSGATGIPQALPGDKMATHGADWATNPQTQIRWGADYIKGRYVDPLGAWAHFLKKNWY